MNVVSCLVMGFETVAHHPKLIIIPTLLDLFLWLGPHLSFTPLFQTIAQVAQAVGTESGEDTVALQQLLTDLAARLNGFIMAGPAPLMSIPKLLVGMIFKYNFLRGWDQNLLGVPSLLAGLATNGRPIQQIQPDFVVSTMLAALGWITGIVVMGALLNTFYLRSVGRRVSEEAEIELPGATSTLSLWGQLLQMMFVLALVSLALFAFLMIVFVLTEMLHEFTARFLLAFVLAMIFFVGLHLIFVVPGIVQLRRELLQAIYESMILVRSDFLSVMLLLLLLFMIARGFDFVWALPAPTSWNMLISIVGHAFVSTALTAALFVFYQDRLHFFEILTHAFAPKDAPVRPLAGK